MSAGLAEAFDKLTSRLQAGEAIGLEEVRQKYPEHADELLQLLPALAALGDLAAAPEASPLGEGVPEALGDFRILREVGRGGMGVVYEAEQLSLQRRVALKVLPFAGTLDPRQLQRFRLEAQAAAALHHSNIVPVYFVGSDRGVHYYAMQFIDGQSLAEIIRALRPPSAAAGTGAQERTTAYRPAGPGASPEGATEAVAGHDTLASAQAARGRDYFRRVAELGVQAAEALDHAHQAGIVHRDVKPANLMLDARGSLWVTDFGLAHVQHGDASLTASGDLVGTLRYMSPEQALAKRAVIDHRTDVYSLGVTLYELLTLEPAFAGGDRQELLRRIAVEEPRPPRRIDRAIPAELETIILKAMEKDPVERYGTAQELAGDLRRFLEDRPIQARRPSWWQVVVKWARRHRTLVTAALTFLVLLAIVLAGSTVWVWRAAVRAGRAEAAALAALDEKQAALETAQQREAESKAVLDFVTNKVIAAARPKNQDGGLAYDVTLQKALAASLPFVEGSFPQQPLVEARLRMTLGQSYLYLRDAKIAEEQFRAAYALYTKHLGPDHPDTLSSMHNLATAYGRVGRRTEALKLLEETLALRKAKLGPDHPDTLSSMFHIAFIYFTLGQYADAIKLSESTLALQKAKLGPDHPDTLECRNFLAVCYNAVGRVADAIQLGEQTLALKKANLGPHQRMTLGEMSNLAAYYYRAGRLREALALQEETLRLKRAHLRPDDQFLAIALGENLAWWLATAPDPKRRDPARAVALAAEAVQIAPAEVECWRALGAAHYRTGKWQEAAAALDKAMRLRTLDEVRQGTIDFSSAAGNAFFLAMVHWQLGDKDKARTWYERAVQYMAKGVPRDEESLRLRAEAEELLGVNTKR
jgi:serine/threonine protein kinase/tetratricopeptide (TPR) repeat protein